MTGRCAVLKINFSNPIIEDDMEELYQRLPESDALKHNSIYISGASGMLASYMVAYLLWLNEKKNYDMQIFAGIRNPQKALARFGDFCDKKYFHIITNDVTQPLDSELKLDYIIHAASLASPQYYGSNPVETVLPNILGTYNLLEYCRKNSVKGFLFYSSGSVYGKVSNVSGIKESDIGILDFLEAGSKYGESKRCGEMLCHSYFAEYQVPTVSGRISHTYGPTMDVKGDRRVFAEFVDDILENKNIEMKSDGSSIRPFAYITDTISGLFKMLLVGSRGEAYNVGNGKELYSILELAKIMTSLRPEKKLKVVRVERKDAGYSSSTGQNTTFFDTKKLENLGWNAKYSVKDGFDRTLKAIEYDNNLQNK